MRAMFKACVPEAMKPALRPIERDLRGWKGQWHLVSHYEVLSAAHNLPRFSGAVIHQAKPQLVRIRMLFE